MDLVLSSDLIHRGRHYRNLQFVPCYCAMISLNLHCTMSLAECCSLGWGAHEAVFRKTGPELPLHFGWTSSIAIHQSGCEAVMSEGSVYNEQAWKLAMDIYLMGHVREGSSLTRLVICSTLNTLNWNQVMSWFTLSYVQTEHASLRAGQVEPVIRLLFAMRLFWARNSMLLGTLVATCLD
jgi:hypothetical protein